MDEKPTDISFTLETISEKLSLIYNHFADGITDVDNYKSSPPKDAACGLCCFWHLNNSATTPQKGECRYSSSAYTVPRPSDYWCGDFSRRM